MVDLDNFISQTYRHITYMYNEWLEQMIRLAYGNDDGHADDNDDDDDDDDYRKDEREKTNK